MKLRNLFLTLLFLAPIVPLQADISDLKLTAGYRRDNIQEWLRVCNERGSIIGKAHVKEQKISIYQVGAKGSVCAAGIAARAEIYFGWVDSGNYSAALLRSEPHPASTREGSIKKGKTRDENLGVAYFFVNNTFCQIGPSAGYSKNHQHFSVGKIKNNGSREHMHERSNLTNQWKGPWVGADACCQIACISAKGGYEYHFAHWKATSKLTRSKGVERISAKADSKQARGKVLYAEASWNFCQCFTIGGAAKWQQWTARKSHNSKVERMVASWLSSKKNKTIAKWNSFMATVDLGYSF